MEELIWVYNKIWEWLDFVIKESINRWEDGTIIIIIIIEIEYKMKKICHGESKEDDFKKNRI